MLDPCEKCEEVLQPFLDRELSDAEYREAEAHLDECSYCRKRYKFEETLRMYVRQAFAEEMPPDLKAKLAAFQAEHARIASLTDLMLIVGIAFGAVGLAHALAAPLSAWFGANVAWAKTVSLHEPFVWVVMLSTAIGLGLSFTRARRLEGADDDRPVRLRHHLGQEARQRRRRGVEGRPAHDPARAAQTGPRAAGVRARPREEITPASAPRAAGPPAPRGTPRRALR